MPFSVNRFFSPFKIWLEIGDQYRINDKIGATDMDYETENRKPDTHDFGKVKYQTASLTLWDYHRRSPKIQEQLAFVHSLKCNSIDEEKKESFYVRRRAMIVSGIESEVISCAWKMWSQIQGLQARKRDEEGYCGFQQSESEPNPFAK